MKLFGIFSGLFGAKAPETIESLKEELSHVEYVLRNGYKKDREGLEKEKAEIEAKIRELQSARDAEAVKAASSAK